MALAPVFLEHHASLEHDTGTHPEQPARITAIEQELRDRGWLGLERLISPPVDRATLTAVHPDEYVGTIEGWSVRGGGQLDLDTVVSEGSFVAALHAAGGAVKMVDLLLDGVAQSGFSSHRPPGHHALRGRAMGFCLFNNVAVAARHAIDARGLGRVMIFDWDVHHGNGTNDIFYEDDQVLFISIHQSPLYPGTGASSEAGRGDGLGYTVNIPVPPGSGDAVYRSVVDHVVVPLALEYKPELVLISAGYDAHREDPLADIHVTEAGFAAMTRSLWRCSAELEVPLGCVLEGGYALRPLARSVATTLEVLSAPAPAVDDGASAEDVEVAPLSLAVLERLRPWWPGVGAPA
jgi:acetoin utilization deacetylase AcuC-like enzyme